MDRTQGYTLTKPEPLRTGTEKSLALYIRFFSDFCANLRKITGSISRLFCHVFSGNTVHVPQDGTTIITSTTSTTSRVVEVSRTSTSL